MSRLVEELEDYDDSAPTTAKPRRNKIAGMDKPEEVVERDSNDRKEPIPAERASTDLSHQEPDSGCRDLCISGRGLLDDAVSEMLGQLLKKNGLAARAEPYEAASRSQIDDFRPEGAAMVCISSLEITGSPSHLRYLVAVCASVCRVRRSWLGLPARRRGDRWTVSRRRRG